MIVSAAMGALALTLPLAFHAVGLGSKFLPMLLPLLLNGFLSPLPWALLTGAAMPLVSALLTGMPPLYPPVALIVCSEGAVLAGVAAAIYSLTRPRVWPALIAAVVAGRATAFGLSWVIALKFGLPAAMASGAMLLQGLPGVVLQLAAVPIVLRALSKRKGLLFVDKPESEATLFR
jgi:hypothetical protein